MYSLTKVLMCAISLTIYLGAYKRVSRYKEINKTESTERKVLKHKKMAHTFYTI